MSTAQDEKTAATEVAAAIGSFYREFPETGSLGPLEWRRGQGTAGHPVILMPGAGGTTEFFAFVADGLRAGGLNPIFVDYAGTPPPEELAAALTRLIRHLELKSASVLGCSYSAYWSQHLAQGPGIGGLILCNGFVEARDLQPNPLFDHAAIQGTDENQLMSEWHERAKAQSATRLGQLMIGAMTGGLAPRDLRGRLLQVSSSRPVRSSWNGPVTLLDCVDDPLVRDAARARFREAWPGSRYLTLPEGGHYPYVLTPETFTHSILDATKALAALS